MCVARLSRVSASAAAAAAAAGVRDAGAVPSLDPAVSHRGGGGRAAVSAPLSRRSSPAFGSVNRDSGRTPGSVVVARAI